MSLRIRSITLGITFVVLSLTTPATVSGQNAFIRDLTISDTDVPVQLVGYGIVSGLEGTGDRAMGAGQGGGGMTVRSIVNMLRRFGIEVPPTDMRSRNVAAVLVTAEASPYLRPGGRIDVNISSIGDATSLRGGVLLMTPLLLDVGGAYVATAQGPIMISDGYEDFGVGRRASVETSGRIPMGGVLEQPLPAIDFMQSNTILLRTPDLSTAQTMIGVINQALGNTIATLLDPGAIRLQLDADPAARAQTLTQIMGLSMTPTQRAVVLVDSRTGSLTAGGDIQVGEATVSHAGVTLTVGSTTGVPNDPTAPPGAMRFGIGTSVQEVAEALHAVATPPAAIAAIFTQLRDIGALSAQVVVR